MIGLILRRGDFARLVLYGEMEIKEQLYAKMR